MFELWLRKFIQNLKFVVGLGGCEFDNAVVAHLLRSDLLLLRLVYQDEPIFLRFLKTEELLFVNWSKEVVFTVFVMLF